MKTNFDGKKTQMYSKQTSNSCNILKNKNHLMDLMDLIILFMIIEIY